MGERKRRSTLQSARAATQDICKVCFITAEKGGMTKAKCEEEKEKECRSYYKEVSVGPYSKT